MGLLKNVFEVFCDALRSLSRSAALHSAPPPRPVSGFRGPNKFSRFTAEQFHTNDVMVFFTGQPTFMPGLFALFLGSALQNILGIFLSSYKLERDFLFHNFCLQEDVEAFQSFEKQLWTSCELYILRCQSARKNEREYREGMFHSGNSFHWSKHAANYAAA